MTLPARHDGDMYRAAVLLSLASVLLAALALISCLSVEDKSTIRGMPRFLWVLVILLLPLVGPAAWFLAGRPVPPGRSPFGWSVPGWPEPPRRPKAPDDDPDFLRSLSRFTPNPPPGRTSSQAPDQPPSQIRNDPDDDLLRRWEEDLRQKEDERRRRERGEG